MTEILALVIAYLLGSIPSAYYMGKWVKGVDLRTVGSGNLGFTNAWRVLGFWMSLPVFAFDVGKGAAAVLVARALAPGLEWLAIAAGLAAILGHNWTIFLGFKGGGKGVAASAGVFAALTPVPFAITFTLFLIILFTTKYMSIASISGAVILVACIYTAHAMGSVFAPSIEVTVFATIAATLLIIKHKSNIQRLWAGTEPRIGRRKPEETS
ncbi:glycerol-3-phosphate 1-O-acyltransferase PlsY [bacterium]|nr:glycerol-3-phosphate 1-O-acyltransferase PlsY [bacterium]